MMLTKDKSISLNYILEHVIEKQNIQYKQSVYFVLSLISNNTNFNKHFFFRNKCFSIATDSYYYCSPRIILPNELHKHGNYVYDLKKELDKTTDIVKSGLRYIYHYSFTIADLYALCPYSIQKYLPSLSGEITLDPNKIQEIKNNIRYSYLTKQLTINMLLYGD